MTRFQYDLNGDGTEEEYWFGVVSSIQNGTRPMIRDSTGFYVGGSCVRTVAPAVWKMSERSEYEQVPEFALLLEHPQVNLHCVKGVTQPSETNAGALFGLWPGTIRVTFTHDGLWVYECSAQLDGRKLTAAAVTEAEIIPPGT